MLRRVWKLMAWAVVLLPAAAYSAQAPSAVAHGSYCYAQDWGYTPPDYEVDAANSYIFGVCAAVPAGTYHQESGYHYVYQPLGYGSPYYYSQHNSDEYVQQSVNGPACSGSVYPACSYYGQWNWYIYWQRNPNNWHQEQVNTYNGGPYWARAF